MTPGRVTGIDDDGEAQDELSLRGTAADLECWVWNRPQDGALEKNGDATAPAALQKVVAVGVQ